ncbi:hypothetical protein I5V28_05500 [Stenotrophomonas maltophilia]|uniref:hypothetical protein n=4 Tax=Stenotrophomonas maltophilia TaxID=40324 RepID=UPI0015DE84C0|nr:hypothetical protein [Stenotrophomonas maltophilia]MBH1599063.1 hypothetical protein [Stenotrophomonas maltophilia]MBH1745283.1 hypothetical protein [Stenotrophomonas maltophilia]MBH1779112.1 hypothetical protein [Stenotrophomonas maltophilia]
MNFHVDFLDGFRKARLPIHKFKVDRPVNLSTVVADKILTKGKNCGAKAAVFPNITSRAEGVICSLPTTAFTEAGAKRPVAALSFSWHKKKVLHPSPGKAARILRKK